MPLDDYPATKKKLFLAASKLFSQKCYADVGIREIADEAGVKVPTVYNHYPSKEAILEDLFQFYTDRITHFYDAAEHFDFDDDLVACFKKMLFIFDPPEVDLMRQLMRLVFIEQYRSPQAARIIYDIMLRGGKEIDLAFLSHLKDKGVIQCDNIDSMAEIISRAAVTFAMQYVRDDEKDRSPDYEKVMTDLFRMLHYPPPKT